MTSINRATSANIQCLHLVAIGPHEQKGRAGRYRLSVRLEAKVKKRITLQHGPRCPNKCRPFPVSKSLLLLSLTHDTWIKTKTGVIQEYSAIEFTNINFDCSAVRDRFNCFIQLEGYLHVLRKMI